MRAAQANWSDRLAPGQFRQLFDRLPGTMLFVKDADFRLRMANPAFVERCGKKSEDDLIGLTDDELFPPRMSTKFRRDDEQVLRTGEPLFDLIELFPNRTGRPEWAITDKLPLFDLENRICGLCGTVRSYEEQRAALTGFLELEVVTEHLKQHYREPLDVERLAAMVGLSTRQFGRKFRATFDMTPRTYLIRLRVMRACDLLAATDSPITEIAVESGFYDHADFARQFQRHMGQTATAYRHTSRSAEL